MKTLNALKIGALSMIILIFYSFNFTHVDKDNINVFEDTDWEQCLQDASGKIASSYASSVLNVEYEYAGKDFKVKNGVRNPEIKFLNVKMIVHWTINETSYYAKGTLITDSNCCNASWELAKSSNNMNESKSKINLGCVAGSSTNARASMGVGRPFVRKKKRS